MKTFQYDGIRKQLKSAEERRLYARDLALLTIAETVRAVAKQAGISQTQLAGRLGRTKGFVSQVLNGTRNMTISTLADFLSALDLELAEVRTRQLGVSQAPVALFDEWLDSNGIEVTSTATPESSLTLQVEPRIASEGALA